MTRTFVIDALPESAAGYRSTHALVAVDVFRATSVIVTALAGGHPVYPVGTLHEALNTAGRLRQAILAGEQAGVKPDGFDFDNSPVALESEPGHEPIVLLTSAGTLLLANCRGASAIYIACLRNFTATARELVGHRRVALIGAGTRGQARDEDQMVCAWIGDQLRAAGCEPENESTLLDVERWRGADPSVLRSGPSADFLRSSGQMHDLEWVLAHVDDLDAVAIYNGQQVSLVKPDIDAGLMADAT